MINVGPIRSRAGREREVKALEIACDGSDAQHLSEVWLVARRPGWLIRHHQPQTTRFEFLVDRALDFSAARGGQP